MHRYGGGARAQVKLIFVYNAKPGIAAGIMDSIHKTLSPATYPCDLCTITYGALRMDPAWKAWLKAQPFESEFRYRDEFRAAHPEIDASMPAVFREDGGRLELLVKDEDFASTPTVDALIALIESRIA